MRQASQATNWSAKSDETVNGLGSVSWAAFSRTLPWKERMMSLKVNLDRSGVGSLVGVCDGESRGFEMKRYETFHADDRGQGREELRYNATEQ
jgi:hypothetical protein